MTRLSVGRGCHGQADNLWTLSAADPRWFMMEAAIYASGGFLCAT